jgi:hypothetical protein
MGECAQKSFPDINLMVLYGPTILLMVNIIMNDMNYEI